MSYDIYTFGCKVNMYDTTLLQQRLEKVGLLTSSETSKIHIINTCAVTKDATMEAGRYIRRYKRKDPESVIVVTGCAAQVDNDYFEALPEVDLIVANSHKGLIEDLIVKYLKGELSQRVFHSNIFRKEDLEEGGGLEESHTRAFLKIQDGCNSFCTYCVIPFARGKSRSLSPEYLANKIRDFENQGLNEVVLTGVHIADYRYEVDGKKWDLEDLLEYILKNTKISRIRLTSLEPREVTDRLLDLYKDPRMCPHFHMSIQSASTSVLVAMRRKYTAEDVVQVLHRIEERVKNPFVGMDVIVGFPGESDQDFEDTFKALESTPWTRIHVFPYSERPGTKALKIEPKVPQHIIRLRSERLRALSSERYSLQALQQIGAEKEILVLKSRAKGGSGLSRDYWPVDVEVPPELEGKEIRVRITGYDQSNKSRIDGYLKGQFDA